MATDDPTRPDLDTLRAEFDRSAEDVATGRTEPVEGVLAGLRARAAERRPVGRTDAHRGRAKVG